MKKNISMLLLALVTGVYNESRAAETLLALHENLHDISCSTLQQIQNKAYAAISAEHRKGGLNNTELEALFNILKYDVAEALELDLFLYNYGFKPNSTEKEEALTYRSSKTDKSLFIATENKNKRLINLMQAHAGNNKEEIANILQEFTSRYKIHLMPQKHHIPEILYKFLREVKNNTSLREAISGFKFYITEPEKRQRRIPTIVIYAELSKEQAQTVLDEIYRLFKEYPGVNAIGPRWNAKVTDLIWWAQGNGDEKRSTWEKAGHHFEDHLGTDFIKNLYVPGDDEGNGRATFRADITGTIMDYSLRNPAEEIP